MQLEYDLICSLGGNCTAAHNLRYRNMRLYSLPFDWCYFTTPEALTHLAHGFKNQFSDFCKKENMQKLEDNSAHQNIFKDNFSKYIFPNHIQKSELDAQTYNEFYQTFNRRVQRLFECIEKSNNILFLLSSPLQISEDILKTLHQELSDTFSNKNIFLKVLLMNNPEEKEINDGNLTINQYHRPFNKYDFQRTNFEWQFMDQIKLTKKTIKRGNPILQYKKLKRGFSIQFFPHISTIISTKCYLLGFNLQLIIGKEKEWNKENLIKTFFALMNNN